MTIYTTKKNYKIKVTNTIVFSIYLISYVITGSNGSYFKLSEFIKLFF